MDLPANHNAHRNTHRSRPMRFSMRSAHWTVHKRDIMRVDTRTAHKPHIDRPFPAPPCPLHHPRMAPSKFEAGAISFPTYVFFALDRKSTTSELQSLRH